MTLGASSLAFKMLPPPTATKDFHVELSDINLLLMIGILLDFLFMQDSHHKQWEERVLGLPSGG